MDQDGRLAFGESRHESLRAHHNGAQNPGALALMRRKIFDAPLASLVRKVFHAPVQGAHE